jgi:hypothetical protein
LAKSLTTRNRLLRRIDLIFQQKLKKCAIVNVTGLMEGHMKVLLVALTLLFSTAIMLIAGFQFIRLFASELIEMVSEAWRSLELPSSH